MRTLAYPDEGVGRKVTPPFPIDFNKLNRKKTILK